MVNYIKKFIRYESRIDVYEDGKWKTFMNFNSVLGGMNCENLVKRLKLGGNTVIEF